LPYSPECVEGRFSEDEMRRPTPYAVPLEGLQMLDGLLLISARISKPRSLAAGYSR
jgi:hypothetical protein